MHIEHGDLYPSDRVYRLDLKHCLIRTCDGELAEMSYYERNNWVTIELKCTRCEREFTVKVES
jgi:hypothetical protein